MFPVNRALAESVNSSRFSYATVCLETTRSHNPDRRIDFPHHLHHGQAIHYQHHHVSQNLCNIIEVLRTTRPGEPAQREQISWAGILPEDGFVGQIRDFVL